MAFDRGINFNKFNMKKISLVQMEQLKGEGCGWSAVGVISSQWGLAIGVLTASGPIGWAAVGIAAIGFYASVDGIKNC